MNKYLFLPVCPLEPDSKFARPPTCSRIFPGRVGAWPPTCLTTSLARVRSVPAIRQFTIPKGSGEGKMNILQYSFIIQYVIQTQHILISK